MRYILLAFSTLVITMLLSISTNTYAYRYPWQCNAIGSNAYVYYGLNVSKASAAVTAYKTCKRYARVCEVAECFRR